MSKVVSKLERKEKEYKRKTVLSTAYLVTTALYLHGGMIGLEDKVVSGQQDPKREC